MMKFEIAGSGVIGINARNDPPADYTISMLETAVKQGMVERRVVRSSLTSYFLESRTAVARKPQSQSEIKTTQNRNTIIAEVNLPNSKSKITHFNIDIKEKKKSIRHENI